MSNTNLPANTLENDTFSYRPLQKQREMTKLPDKQPRTQYTTLTRKANIS